MPDRTALFVSGPVSQPPLRRFGVAEPTNSGEFATAVAFRFHDPDDGADGIWQIARLPEAAREVAVQLGRPMVEVCLGEFAGDTFRGLDTRNYATLQLAHMTGVFARALVVVSDLGSI
ncbi:MAG TPA: hypothetical protein VKQ34_02585 [Candidatus Saccharimonadales bacterium]|nr:hypothetical protein [Candidatus Saccharimonadales bacterium]